ncbi:MAG: hypothetical protein ACFBSF_08905 [Leptolyngbyaceae cyanobacterium]
MIEALGWTRDEAAEVRHQLASFQEDCDAPGMEVYDDDVVLVFYPNSDLATYSKRPALWVQVEDLKTGLPQKISAMITRTPRQGETRVAVSQDSNLGKATDSSRTLVLSKIL